ncbi:MAG: hypothetical protein LH603_04980 [Pseudonocardia sp.]|nr:hypothetical protein [Pseudonocardia sp.]
MGASTLTLGGLLKHLAVVEDHIFTTKLSGQPLGAPWNTADRDDPYEWPFTSADHRVDRGGVDTGHDPPQRRLRRSPGALGSDRAGRVDRWARRRPSRRSR